jgi:hypothetical protein
MEVGGRPTPAGGHPEWRRLHWAAGLGAQRREVASPIGAQRDRLAVDQRVLGGQLANCLGDPRQPVGEIRAVTAHGVTRSPSLRARSR